MTSRDPNLAPLNPFKLALAEGRVQTGIWQGLTSPEAVTICADAGFDWLLLDAEHSPNDLAMLRSQLVAMQASDTHAIVRPPLGETWMIKQVLDLGVQTVLVPMIDTAEQARDMVLACRYPPEGKRGVGSALARASNYGRRKGYLNSANEQICLLVQVETKLALENLDEILQVEGVDGVFIGPADLSSDMGFRGQPDAPEVRAAISDAITRIAAAGKAPGILLGDPAWLQQSVDEGALFLGVGNDVAMLVQASTALAAQAQALKK